MTSLPTPSDTVRLRSRLSPAQLQAVLDTVLEPHQRQRHRLETLRPAEPFRQAPPPGRQPFLEQRPPPANQGWGPPAGVPASSPPPAASAPGVAYPAPTMPASSPPPAASAPGVAYPAPTMLAPAPPGAAARVAVRAFDLAVATLALVILAPLMILVGLAVKIESPGPLLYASPRIGHRKPMFKAWKFRSMHHDADRRLAEILRTNAWARDEYRRFHKLRHDPRLTVVGSLIRKTSLDELPQLFNILRGEMSVVGPRPNLLSERDLFGPHLPVVLLVKPGLTGLWQVSGRNRLPAVARVTLDVEYVNSRSLLGDLRICAKTLCQLWRPHKHGAY